MASADVTPAGAMAGHTAHGREKSDAMAQEMGRGASMDMQAMVRDMRNRFGIALIFSLPLFVLSPMGLDFIQISPPFSLLKRTKLTGIRRQRATASPH
jgi:P-type Cu2+ transporter